MFIVIRTFSGLILNSGQFSLSRRNSS